MLALYILHKTIEQHKVAALSLNVSFYTHYLESLMIMIMIMPLFVSGGNTVIMYHFFLKP